MMIWLEIAERAETASGPDRELDLAVWKLNGGAAGKVPLPWIACYSESADACLALLTEVLPGWTIAGIRQDDGRCWWVELREGFATSYNRVVIAPGWVREPRLRGCPTPALALLAALARAKGEGEGNG